MKPKTKNIITWIIAGLLTVAFLGSGITKLMGQEMHVQNFQKWGFPIAFMYVVGILELLGAIGLVIKKLRPLAGLCLALLMIGAAGTHVVHGEWGSVAPPLILLILSVILFTMRKGELIASKSEIPMYSK